MSSSSSSASVHGPSATRPAAGQEQQQQPPSPSKVAVGVEEAAAVVRPELVVCRDVVGTGVPETVPVGESGVTVEGRWRHYLAWHAPARRGQREVREMRDRVELPDGRSLWVRPLPAAPVPPTQANWSAASRQAWLDGAPAPTPGSVFCQLYEVLDEFLDVGQDEAAEAAERAREAAEAEARAKAPPPPIIPDDRIPPAPPPPPARRARPDPWNPSPSALMTRPDVVEMIRTQEFPERHPSPHPVICTLALWTMLTYCYPAWDAVPYLYVGGPAGSGKTRVFELLSRLVFRPIVSSNVSAAALFRTLHERGGTLLLDEAERLNEGAPEVAEIRSVLLAGYKRGGRASRLEAVGETYRMQEFDVFGPKAIACIAGVDGPLATRCIPIQMIRSAPGSPRPKRRIDADPQRWQHLRDALHTCLLGEMGKCAPTMRDASHVCELGGRPGELWQPLLAMSILVDLEDRMKLHTRMSAFAAEQADAGRDEPIPEDDLQVLRMLTRKRHKDQAPTPADLLHSLKYSDAQRFGRWTPKRVACCLRTYGVVTTKTRTRREYWTAIDHLRRIEQSYGIDLNTENRPPLMIPT